jgi:predicted permease
MSGLPPDRPAVAAGTVIENYMNSDGRPVELVDYYQAVVGDYFSTMGIPLIAGRGFQAADATSESRVVVVNESLAKKIWKDENPIGKRLRPNYGTLGFANSTWHTVVGIAKDVKQGGVAKTTGTELYIPLDQLKLAPPTMNVVLRTAVAPEALARSIDQAVREVDRAVPVVRLRAMEAVFDESIQRPRVLASLLGAFAGLALMLAAVGTFGVISYLVSERRRELGIRLALGAARTSVFALVMRDGLVLTLAGIAIGVVSAFSINRFFATLLYGVQPTDAVTLGAVAATITLVAALACWIPAWRASRLNPNEVLKHE